MKEEEKKFAFDYLVPEKGKFIFHTLASSIGLFILVYVFLFVDYNKFLSLENSLIILFFCFLISITLWSLAYGYSFLKK